MLRKTSVFSPIHPQTLFEQLLQSLELVLVFLSAYLSDIIMQTPPLSDPQNFFPMASDSYEILSLCVAQRIA